MATNEVLVKYGTQLSIADHSGGFVTGSPHGPATPANSLIIGTPTEVQINLKSIGAAAARESSKTASLARTGSSWPEKWTLGACIENATAPTAGGTYDFYWNASPNSTAGVGNSGNASGTDSVYTATSQSLSRLILIGRMQVDNQVTSKKTYVGTLILPYLYGSLIIVNNTSTATDSVGDESHIVLTPVIPDVQAAA